ncbi:MAG TPA: flagellar biosynthetic protein FliO [Burkholderiaceae bacterium]|nr:flagellar biosynthetic protein FliO [Burkholderiaceae bacterium]
MNNLNTALSFFAVIAMVPLALWLFKRTPAGRRAANNLLRTVAAMPVAPNQRVLMVEVGSGESRRWLVLGVTSQQITTLYSLAPYGEVPATAEEAVPASFAQVLGRFRK